MPIFFFNLWSQESLKRDNTGLELASAEIAFIEACKAIPELTDELARTGGTPRDYAFEIADEAGRILWRIPFSEVLGRRLGL